MKWLKREGAEPDGGPMGALSMLGIDPQVMTRAVAQTIDRLMLALEHIGGAAEAISVQLEHQGLVLTRLETELGQIQKTLAAAVHAIDDLHQRLPAPDPAPKKTRKKTTRKKGGAS